MNVELISVAQVKKCYVFNNYTSSSLPAQINFTLQYAQCVHVIRVASTCPVCDISLFSPQRIMFV
jgi:hypothetical protein